MSRSRSEAMKRSRLLLSLVLVLVSVFVHVHVRARGGETGTKTKTGTKTGTGTGAVVEAPAADFPTDVLTDRRDVRACLPLEGGAVLAGTGGGLVLVRSDGSARAPWTALDGLPETRIHALLHHEGVLWIG